MLGGPGGRHMVLESDTSKPKNTGETLRRFAHYLKPYWPVLLLAAIFIITATWAQVTVPELLGQATDCYLTPPTPAMAGSLAPAAAASSTCWYEPSRDQLTTAERIAGLGGLVLKMFGLYAAGSVLTGLTFFTVSWSGQHALRSIRVDLFKQLHRLSLGYYGENDAGNLMSRITNDSETIQQALGFALVQVLSGLLLIVWIAYNMLRENIAYALISLAVVPFMFLATLWLSGQARKAFRKSRQQMGNVNAELEESISGVREVQAFSRESENIQAFRDVNAANRDANIRAVAFTSALHPTLEALGYVAIAIVAGVGGFLLLRNQTLFGTVVSIGTVITFLAYVQRINGPVQQISVMWATLQSAIAGGERIFGLLDVVPDIQDKADARKMPKIEGHVVFDAVRSEYKQDEPVLRGVSFEAKPGEMIAVVGPTGAGKTTIINLLPRFYDVSGGAVKIDGLDVREVTAASLREQIGIVLQDNFLFSDTIMNNIRFGRLEATDDEVIAAAKLAHADTFIEGLPDKYQTVLGERGRGLSSGQRQLIAIARAALANPRILVLDEATSSVDTRTEKLIQAAIEKLLSGRTSFVIAHRLSTIKHADQILVLQDGEIIERGKFNELLEQKGFFYDLYMSQFRRQEPMGLASSGNGQKAEGGLNVATATA
ncbi:putative ABC transporter ATP-binding protein [Thermoflexales bacterium]|nr:putative ABC transporter ATP-binding protein [Thermoflexales bacterium]